MNDRDQANKAIEDDDGNERDKKVSTQIAAAFDDSGPDLFHSDDGTAYATVSVKGVRQTLRIESRRFKQYLRALWYQQTGEPAASQPINDAASMIDAIAVFDRPTKPLAVRVTESGGSIWLDLANECGEVVEITPNGWMIMICPADIKFIRHPGMLAIPTPVKGGDLADLRPLINVMDEEWPLVVAWLLGALHPNGPYPILFLNGPQGSAKSVSLRLLRTLLDPNTVTVDTLKNDGRAIAIAAQHQRVPCFDNISSISAQVSDFLCCMSTGGGFRTRALYKDQDEILLTFKRPIIVAGIGDLATRPDLLERAITIKNPPIPKRERRLEREINAEFEEIRPSVLGALLNAACAALANQDVSPAGESVRMADFLAFVEAGEEALGFSPGTVRTAYTANQDEANEIALEESQVATAILADGFPDEWEGTATELLKEVAPNMTQRERVQNGWPSNAIAMGNALKRIEPNLEAAGVKVVRRVTAKRRLIRILKQVVTPVMSSRLSSTGNDNSDNCDDLPWDEYSSVQGRVLETFDD